jgi:hypothetical protein
LLKAGDERGPGAPLQSFVKVSALNTLAPTQTEPPFAARPPPTETTPPINIKLLPVGRVLNWLLNYWNEPTISAWQIYTYGPRPRDPKNTISAAEILVQRGWLTPIRAHRHDRKVWVINREVEQIAAASAVRPGNRPPEGRGVMPN